MAVSPAPRRKGPAARLRRGLGKMFQRHSTASAGGGIDMKRAPRRRAAQRAAAAQAAAALSAPPTGALGDLNLALWQGEAAVDAAADAHAADEPFFSPIKALRHAEIESESALSDGGDQASEGGEEVQSQIASRLVVACKAATAAAAATHTPASRLLSGAALALCTLSGGVAAYALASYGGKGFSGAFEGMGFDVCEALCPRAEWWEDLDAVHAAMWRECGC